MSLVICVTTYNRAEILGRQLESLRSLTASEFTLVVCDDGSSDNSVAVASSFGAHVIGGNNMGIAFNKNRGLFYASAATNASHVLLLDDDTFAVEHGWERDWIRAIDYHGHINFAPPIAEPYTIYGEYTPERPAVATMLSGQCLGFHRRILERLGYMDTRYGRYGGEHTDLTFRALRIGFGGFIVNHNAYFFAIKCGLRVEGCPSSGTAEERHRAGQLFEELRHGSLYRNPWHSEELYEVMMNDMANTLGFVPLSLVDPGLSNLRADLETGKSNAAIKAAQVLQT